MADFIFFSIKTKKSFNKITDSNKMNKKSVWEKNTYGDWALGIVRLQE